MAIVGMYDNSYRRDAAEQGKTDWSKDDGTLHSQCFNGMAINAKRWCSICHSLDHVKEHCPLCPSGQAMKRPSTMRPPPRQNACLRPQANPFDGECDFGERCNYQHICSNCSKHHPASLCHKSAEESSKAK